MFAPVHIQDWFLTFMTSSWLCFGIKVIIVSHKKLGDSQPFYMPEHKLYQIKLSTPLEQYWPIKLFAMMEMFYQHCPIWQSLATHMAVECLKSS